MINVIEFKDLDLRPSGAEKVSRSDLGRVLGKIDGWEALYLPEYMEDNQAQNGAMRDRFSPFAAPPSFDTFSNGQPCLSTNYDSPSHILPDTFTVNPNEWSVFFVLGSMEIISPATRNFVTIPAANTDDVICLNIGISTLGGGRVNIYENSRRGAGNPLRLQYVGGDFTQEIPAMALCTFSTDNGLSIWYNGEKVAENQEDKRPLNFALTKHDMRVWEGFSGNLGAMGVINNDLGKAKMQVEREALFKFFMEKYGIPQL